MKRIEIGQHVRLSQLEQYIFTVTAVHLDGTYSIETIVDGQPLLSYQNISAEMLRPVQSAD